MLTVTLLLSSDPLELSDADGYIVGGQHRQTAKGEEHLVKLQPESTTTRPGQRLCQCEWSSE